MCREAWSEKYNYLYGDMTKNKMKVNIIFSMKEETYILKGFRKKKLLVFLHVVFN